MDNKKNKRFQLGAKTAYTLTEAFKIYEIAQKYSDRSKSATFWKEIEQKGFMPERTGDSLRNFLKVQLK